MKKQINNQKLISVTRRDLSPGYQNVQSQHAVAEFILFNNEIAKEWFETSNSIISLAAKDQEDLFKLCTKLDKLGIVYRAFYEPDINNELTAVCIQPTIEARKVCSHYPLALKEKPNGDVIGINKHTYSNTATSEQLIN